MTDTHPDNPTSKLGALTFSSGELRVLGLSFIIYGSGFRVQGSGFRV